MLSVGLVLALAIVYPVWTILSQSVQVGLGDTSFTLVWYRSLVSPAGLHDIQVTATLVLTSGVLAVIIGMVLAWMVERVDMPFRFLSRLVPVVPLLIPGVMGAAAWAFLLSPEAGYVNVAIRDLLNRGGSGPFNAYTLPVIIFVVTIYIVPFTYTVFYPAFRNVDASLEEAAYIAGASPVRAALTVTFGVVRPAFLGAILLAFVLSMAQFTIPFMLGTQANVDVLTSRIYIAMKTAFPPNIGVATSTAMVALVPSLIFLALQYWLLRRGGYAVVGGKGGRLAPVRNPIVRWVSGLTLMAYAALAFVLPLLAIIHVSFSFYWTGHLNSVLTTHNYQSLFQEYPETLPALQMSGTVALIGATFSTCLAFLVAYISGRSRSRGAVLLDLIAAIPAGIPATVFGLGCLIAFIRPPIVLYGTIWLMLLAYLVIFIPFAVRPISASLRQISQELEDAARISGSTWSGALTRVTLPLAIVSVVGAWALLFVLLSREVDASVYLAGAGVPLVGPSIFDLWNEGRAGYLAAYSLMVIGGSIAVIAITNALPSLIRRSRRRST